MEQRQAAQATAGHDVRAAVAIEIDHRQSAALEVRGRIVELDPAGLGAVGKLRHPRASRRIAGRIARSAARARQGDAHDPGCRPHPGRVYQAPACTGRAGARAAPTAPAGTRRAVSEITAAPADRTPRRSAASHRGERRPPASCGARAFCITPPRRPANRARSPDGTRPPRTRRARILLQRVCAASEHGGDRPRA